MSPGPDGGPTGMLIIAGHLVVDPSERDGYVAGCLPVVRAALAAPGCLDFSITPDTVHPDRIRVYERWEDEPQLLAFRGSGPSGEQQASILGADVRRYEVGAAGPA